jgi:hypothetical protein
MPLKMSTNVAKQFMQLGTIRKGEMQEFTREDKSKGMKPVDLDYFRITYKTGVNATEIEKAIKAVYKDRPTELNFRLAYHTVLDFLS